MPLLVSVMAVQASPGTPATQDPAASPALLRLAVEMPKGEPVTAIPAEPGVAAQHAVVYDWFRIQQIAARAAVLAGTPLDPDHPPATLTAPRLIVVGLPVSCGGRSYAPERIELTDANGQPVAAFTDAVTGDALATLLPDEPAPRGATARTFGRSSLRQGDVVQVTYPTGVCGQRVVVSPPARVTLPRIAGTSSPALPTNAPAPSPIQFEVVIDLYGVPKYPHLLNPPANLDARVMQSILRWRFEPASANGVAVPTASLNTMTFMGTPPLTGANANAPRPPIPAPSPRPNPQQIGVNIERLAAELAAKGEVRGIPLDADGSFRHGALFDRFYLSAVMTRAGLVAGSATTIRSWSDGVTARTEAPPGSMVVVAVPLVCDGIINPPIDVTFTSSSGPGPVRKLGANVTGADLVALLPGVTMPEGAIGARYPNWMLTDALVTIAYAKPACPGPSTEAALHLVGGIIPRILERVTTAKLPDDMASEPPTTVHVNFLVDGDGHPRFATALDGSAALRGPAEEAAGRWRYDPARLNGAPTPTTSMTVPITFTADGQPVTPGPPGSAGRLGVPGPAPNGQPPLSATSRGGINGGDATHDTLSGDMPGLTLATSKCAVADDEHYGFIVDQPVKVGGDAFTGPAREVRYLNALRGPAGEGIHFRRAGSLAAPDRTILDAYEITYAGLDKPMRVYVDEYHFDDPKAPKGLLCGMAIGLTAK
jgi:hypothetical protein